MWRLVNAPLTSLLVITLLFGMIYRYLPDVETWAIRMTKADGQLVQYVVLLDAPRHVQGRCYWPVEIRSAGALWMRFLVTPDGAVVREDGAR